MKESEGRNYKATHHVDDFFFVDFDMGVPPCCLHAMPILPDLQLPKQSEADIVTSVIITTK